MTPLTLEEVDGYLTTMPRAMMILLAIPYHYPGEVRDTPVLFRPMNGNLTRNARVLQGVGHYISRIGVVDCSERNQLCGLLAELVRSWTLRLPMESGVLTSKYI